MGEVAAMETPAVAGHGAQGVPSLWAGPNNEGPVVTETKNGYGVSKPYYCANACEVAVHANNEKGAGGGDHCVDPGTGDKHIDSGEVFEELKQQIDAVHSRRNHERNHLPAVETSRQPAPERNKPLVMLTYSVADGHHDSVRPPFFNARGRLSNPSRSSLGAFKQKQLKQLEDFRRLAKKGHWGAIHSAHFDWYMWPIEDGSQPRWNVLSDDVDELRGDVEWIRRFHEPVITQQNPSSAFSLRDRGPHICTPSAGAPNSAQGRGGGMCIGASGSSPPPRAWDGPVGTCAWRSLLHLPHLPSLLYLPCGVHCHDSCGTSIIA